MAWFTPAELPQNKYYIFGKDGGKELAEKFDVPLLGQIPLVQSIRESGDAGYQHAGLLTYVGAGAQIAVGVLLVLGLFTPLAAAGALAYLVNSLLTVLSAQRQEGYLAIFGPDGVEYLAVLITAVVAIVLAGPGRYGFDAGRGWARRPFIGSFVALLLGIGGGIAAWVFLHSNNPLQ